MTCLVVLINRIHACDRGFLGSHMHIYIFIIVSHNITSWNVRKLVVQCIIPYLDSRRVSILARIFRGLGLKSALQTYHFSQSLAIPCCNLVAESGRSNNTPTTIKQTNNYKNISIRLIFQLVWTSLCEQRNSFTFPRLPCLENPVSSGMFLNPHSLDNKGSCWILLDFYFSVTMLRELGLTYIIMCLSFPG